MTRTEYQRLYYQNHKKEKADYNKEHKEEILAKSKINYFWKRRKDVLKYKEKYYKEHRDEILAYHDKWRKTEAAKISSWKYWARYKQTLFSKKDWMPLRKRDQNGRFIKR